MIGVEPKETIHIYYEREEEKKPFVFLPLLFAFLCLVSIGAVTFYSYEHPTYEQETLTIPAHFFTRTFSTSAQIIPTGRKQYPAVAAHGVLTITNGSVISQELPPGLIFTNKDGVEVATDTSVFVPAGSAAGYGFATVSAHAVIEGNIGNIEAYAIDRVEGTSIYIRNLKPFSGGSDAYIVTFVTSQDKQIALDSARAILVTQEAQIRAMLTKPCNESSQIQRLVIRLVLACQFASYPSLPGMKITRVRLFGKKFLVEVMFVVRPHVMLVPK